MTERAEEFWGFNQLFHSHPQQSDHFMANRWGKNGGSAVTVFTLLGSKITAEMTLAKKLKRLLLGRKAMTNRDSILKSKDTTLMTKVHIVKAMFLQ